MSTTGKIWLWWSSGKDSAWALHRLRNQGMEVDALVTTVNRRFERVAMHAVRETLLQRQAAAAGVAHLNGCLNGPSTLI